mmetsp:Transcript_7782/g.16162  ORF Transcript_7782/g.16162 Transcript_7782/m.16162 type:complete len:91 (-) Transcript_7782:378-650(-)
MASMAPGKLRGDRTNPHGIVTRKATRIIITARTTSVAIIVEWNTTMLTMYDYMQIMAILDSCERSHFSGGSQVFLYTLQTSLLLTISSNQ